MIRAIALPAPGDVTTATGVRSIALICAEVNVTVLQPMPELTGVTPEMQLIVETEGFGYVPPRSPPAGPDGEAQKPAVVRVSLNTILCAADLRARRAVAINRVCAVKDRTAPLISAGGRIQRLSPLRPHLPISAVQITCAGIAYEYVHTTGVGPADLSTAGG